MTRYVRPLPEPQRRRVYVLPADMVSKLHEAGQKLGLPSEVAVVRKLLDEQLRERGF